MPLIVDLLVDKAVGTKCFKSRPRRCGTSNTLCLLFFKKNLQEVEKCILLQSQSGTNTTVRGVA